MSGLNDFFAKKDRKKKKSSTRTTIAPPIETRPIDEDPEESIPKVAVPPPPKPADDGWIEIDDPRGSQVNTGGRTIVEFKRDGEEKEQNGEGIAPTEKFSGWGKTEKAEVEQDSEEGDGEKPAVKSGVPVNMASSAFPSLADSANAPKLPVNRGKSSSGSGTGTSTNPSRKRFINSNAEKLRQKLAERDASRMSK